MFPQTTSSIPDGSPQLRAAFIGITLLLSAFFVAGVFWASIRYDLTRAVAARHAALAAIGCGLWIGITGVAGARGVLRFDGRPPTMVVLLLLVLVLAFGVALSPVGRRLALGIPVAALVGFQGFRVLVELAMHRAYSEGLMPVQMSYSGRNFDIVSGLTALAVGAWLATGERPAWRRVVFAWNSLGVILLINILAVALLSAPTRLRVFMNEPANIWVTRTPWVWLPAVMVLAAIIGHLLVYRRFRLPDPVTR